MKKLLILGATLILAAIALASCAGGGCEHKNVSPNPDDKSAKEATCFAEGYKPQMICDDCGEVVSESKTLPKVAHPADKYVKTVPVEPTCQKTGRTAGVKCGVCDEFLVKSATVPKKAHVPVETGTVEATATTDGHEGGTHCASCFQTLSEPTVIPAEHSHKDISSEGEHLAVSKEAVAPTCTAEGSTAEIICTICNEVVQKSVSVPACGHKLAEQEAEVASTCITKGKTAILKCQYEGCEHTEGGEEIPINRNNHPVEYWELTDAVAPTCYADGYLQGIKCTAEGCPLGGKPFSQSIDKNRPEHTLVVGSLEVAPDCKTKTDGKTLILVCSAEECDHEEGGKAIRWDKAHEYVPDEEATAPDCSKEQNGKTASYKCKRCDAVSGGDEIPFNHNMQVIEEATEPDCTTKTPGKTETKKCQNEGCEHTEGGEEIPFSHTPSQENEEKCGICGETISSEPTT